MSLMRIVTLVGVIIIGSVFCGCTSIYSSDPATRREAVDRLSTEWLVHLTRYPEHYPAEKDVFERVNERLIANVDTMSEANLKAILMSYNKFSETIRQRALAQLCDREDRFPLRREICLAAKEKYPEEVRSRAAECLEKELLQKIKTTSLDGLNFLVSNGRWTDRLNDEQKTALCAELKRRFKLSYTPDIRECWRFWERIPTEEQVSFVIAQDDIFMLCCEFAKENPTISKSLNEEVVAYFTQYHKTEYEYWDCQGGDVRLRQLIWKCRPDSYYWTNFRDGYVEFLEKHGYTFTTLLREQSDALEAEHNACVRRERIKGFTSKFATLDEDDWSRVRELLLESDYPDDCNYHHIKEHLTLEDKKKILRARFEANLGFKEGSKFLKTLGFGKIFEEAEMLELINKKAPTIKTREEYLAIRRFVNQCCKEEGANNCRRTLVRQALSLLEGEGLWSVAFQAIYSNEKAALEQQLERLDLEKRSKCDMYGTIMELNLLEVALWEGRIEIATMFYDFGAPKPSEDPRMWKAITKLENDAAVFEWFIGNKLKTPQEAHDLALYYCDIPLSKVIKEKYAEVIIKPSFPFYVQRMLCQDATAAVNMPEEIVALASYLKEQGVAPAGITPGTTALADVSALVIPASIDENAPLIKTCCAIMEFLVDNGEDVNASFVIEDFQLSPEENVMVEKLARLILASPELLETEYASFGLSEVEANELFKAIREVRNLTSELSLLADSASSTLSMLHKSENTLEGTMKKVVQKILTQQGRIEPQRNVTLNVPPLAGASIASKMIDSKELVKKMLDKGATLPCVLIVDSKSCNVVEAPDFIKPSNTVIKILRAEERKRNRQ